MQNSEKESPFVNIYERDPSHRKKCIEHYGYNCQICNFSFESKFGEIGKEFCHVHHIEPISETGGEYVVDPKEDLIPVCPNCHAMLHRRKPALKPKELRDLLNKVALENN